MIVVLLSVFCTLTLALPALLVWRAPTIEELTLLGLTALLATSGHYCMTRALEAAEVSAVQPLGCLKLGTGMRWLLKISAVPRITRITEIPEKRPPWHRET